MKGVVSTKRFSAEYLKSLNVTQLRRLARKSKTDLSGIEIAGAGRRVLEAALQKKSPSFRKERARLTLAIENLADSILDMSRAEGEMRRNDALSLLKRSI